jgi:hypothetical protein
LAAGLAIATWFVRLFGAVGVSTALPYDFEPRVDTRVIFTTAALLLVGVGVTAVGFVCAGGVVPDLVRGGQDHWRTWAPNHGRHAGRALDGPAVCRHRSSRRIPSPLGARDTGRPWKPHAGDGDLWSEMRQPDDSDTVAFSEDCWRRWRKRGEVSGRSRQLCATDASAWQCSFLHRRSRDID